MYLPIELDNDALKLYLELKRVDASFHANPLAFTDTDLVNRQVLRGEFGTSLHNAVDFALNNALRIPNEIKGAQSQADLFEGEG
ncbi:MAG: hypothetical protein V3W52_17045 [Syntrophobacteria bacterium]